MQHTWTCTYSYCHRFTVSELLMWLPHLMAYDWKCPELHSLWYLFLYFMSQLVYASYDIHIEILVVQGTSAQIFQTSKSHLKILGTKKSNRKPVPNSGSTKIKCHHTKFSHHGDMASSKVGSRFCHNMSFGETNWLAIIIWCIKTYLVSLSFCWPIWSHHPLCALFVWCKTCG